MDHQRDAGSAADGHYHQYPPHHDQAEIHYQHNNKLVEHQAAAEQPVAVIPEKPREEPLKVHQPVVAPP